MNSFRILSMVYVFVLQNTGEAFEILVDQNTIVCGRNLTLTCKIEKYKSHLSWIIENDVIPVANCVDNSCSVNPKYADKYQGTHDLDQGILNLTIIKLTKNDIGRKFVCSNGFESVSEIIALRDYEALLFENAEREEVTATSGCNPHGMTVKTKWLKINAKSKDESDFCPKILHSNTTKCLNVPLCGNDQQIQHFEVIDAKSSKKGKYFLKAALTYGNKITKWQISALKYNFKEQDYNECDDLDDWKFNHTACLFLILLCVVCVAVGIAIWCACKRRASKCDRNGDKDREENIAGISYVKVVSNDIKQSVYTPSGNSIKDESGPNMQLNRLNTNKTSFSNESGIESIERSVNSYSVTSRLFDNEKEDILPNIADGSQINISDDDVEEADKGLSMKEISTHHQKFPLLRSIVRRMTCR